MTLFFRSPQRLGFATAIIALACVAAPTSSAGSAPYDLTKFRSVLDDSKLQGPTSATLISQGNFAGQYFDPEFVLVSNQYMKFSRTDWNTSGRRTELRQMNEWRTSDSSANKMIGEVKIFKPSGMNECTFMQIHDSGSAPNKPLIRLVWHGERSGISDGIWAVVRNGAGSSASYTKTHIAPRSSTFEKYEIRVQNNTLKVKLNGVTKISTDVSYWEDLDSYFKAGVYNQGPGSSKVQFRKLRYYD